LKKEEKIEKEKLEKIKNGEIPKHLQQKY